MNVRDLFDLRGRVALITGATRGLGLQMAEALGEMGAKVAITARSPQELDAVTARMATQGIDALGIVSDLGDPASRPAELLVSRIQEHFGGIDILINNAGTVWGKAGKPPETAATWREVMSLNVDGTYALTQHVAKQCLIPKRSGKIIIVSSIAGLGGARPNSRAFATSYHASKGALITLTKMLATQWGQYNINVNAICPGYFPTQLSAGLAAVSDKIIEATPIGRAGGDFDIKGAAVFLASEASRHVTGQALAVDGGATAVIP